MNTPEFSGIRPVWIASYPRSGNTFLRIILEKIFRTPTYSIYNVAEQIYKDPSADPLEEALLLPRNWRELLTKDQSGTRLLIKTHDAPEDDSPAIYIVREGRAATDSYFHFQKKFNEDQPSLTEVIAGACQFGSWSGHYRSWQPRKRSSTLFLKYEDLVARPTEVIPQLAKFLELEPSEGKLPTFEELQKAYPNFFRRGRNTDFETAWTPGQLALFDRLHGDVMKDLGYPLSSSKEPVSDLTLELARSAAAKYARFQDELQNSIFHTRRADEKDSKALRQCCNKWWLRIGKGLGLVRMPRRRPQIPPP